MPLLAPRLPFSSPPSPCAGYQEFAATKEPCFPAFHALFFLPSRRRLTPLFDREQVRAPERRISGIAAVFDAAFENVYSLRRFLRCRRREFYSPPRDTDVARLMDMPLTSRMPTAC